MTNQIITSDLIKAVDALQASDDTLAMRRFKIGELLAAQGFIPETDFKEKEAKAADRKEWYEAATALAKRRFPKAVISAFADDKIKGDMIVKARDGGRDIAKPYREWCMSIPKKRNDLAAALHDYLIAQGKREAKVKGADAAKPRTATQIFFDMVDTYTKAFADDKAGDKFDFDPILARKYLVAMIKELK